MVDSLIHLDYHFSNLRLIERNHSDPHYKTLVSTVHVNPVLSAPALRSVQYCIPMLEHGNEYTTISLVLLLR